MAAPSSRSESGVAWDLGAVPPSQVHACFLYEYARESATIRKLALSFVGFQFTDYAEFFCAHRLLSPATLRVVRWEPFVPITRQTTGSSVGEIRSGRERSHTNPSSRMVEPNVRSDLTEILGCRTA